MPERTVLLMITYKKPVGQRTCDAWEDFASRSPMAETVSAILVPDDDVLGHPNGVDVGPVTFVEKAVEEFPFR